MGKIVLLVEDHPELNSIIRIRLERSGFEVISCFDGASAFERMLEEKPELVILDINIPEINGFEFLKRVRSTPQIEKTKFIILTGIPEVTEDSATDEDWKNKMQVNAFISKPFSSDALLNEVNNLMQ